MSIDQLAFIIENAYHVKFEDWQFGKVIKFKLREGEDYQQIEIEHSVYATLERKYTKIITKWIVDNEQS